MPPARGTVDPEVIPTFETCEGFEAGLAAWAPNPRYAGLLGDARKPAYMKGDCTLGCLAGRAVGGMKMFPPPMFGGPAVVDPAATDDEVDDLPDGGKEDERAMSNTAS